MTAPIFVNLPIGNVKIRDRKRGADPAKVAELAKSIAELGLINPITVTAEGTFLVAGLNRLEACRRLEWDRIPAIVVTHDGLMAERAEIHENLKRDDLTVLERSEHLARDKEIEEELGNVRGRGGDRSSNYNNCSLKSYAKAMAETAGVAESTIFDEVRIAKILSPSERDKIKKEAPSIADNKTDLLALTREKSPEKRAAIIDAVATNKAKNAKEAVGKIKLDEKRALAAELDAAPLPQVTGRFQVIVIDPPWRYDNRAEDVTHRGRNPYPDMTVGEICDLPVADRADDDCVLWLWTTNAFMRDAFTCLDEWGFQEKTILTWVKDRMGTGDWLRGQTEHCIMAVKGKPTVTLSNQTTALAAPLREHSRKPDEFYAMVETLCHGTKLEMFAREERAGWQRWGAETEKFG